MAGKQHLLIGASFAVFLILGSLQGSRIDTLQESELFYRWLLSAGIQIPLSVDERLEFQESAETARGVVDPMDDELYAAIADLAEDYLPDIPIDERSGISKLTGEPYSKLIRAARSEDGSFDDDLWKLTRAGEFSQLRSDFIEYLRSNRLQSVGTRLTISTLYQGEGRQVQGVGVTSLFFGFRKMAANQLWLQVDKYWHSGQMHRMIPIMRACVTLDPSFVDAYLLGAWHLAYNVTAKLEFTPEELKQWSDRYQRYMGVRDDWYYMAAEFLKDGVRDNPRDYRLYFDLGYSIYKEKIEDYDNAVRYIYEATRQYHDVWVERMYYLALTLNGQYEDSIEGWEWYLDPAGGGHPEHHAGVRGLQTNLAYLAEIRHDEALECAEAARVYAGEASGEDARKALAAADRFDALAISEIAAAMAIWEKLNDTGEDSLAISRLSRFEALELWEEGNWQEALAVLQYASFEAVTYFDDLADLMLEIKLSITEDDPNFEDLVITSSERMEIERRARVANRKQPEKTRVRRVDCEYLDEGQAL